MTGTKTGQQTGGSESEIPVLLPALRGVPLMLNSLYVSQHGIAGWLVLLCVMLPLGCNDSESELETEPKPETVSEAKTDRTLDVSYFHNTVRSGSLNGVLSFLNSGIDVNASGPEGINALMIAIESKDVDKMELLMEYGADPEQTDNVNWTALRHAVETNFTDGVRFLLKRGVSRGHHPKYPLKIFQLDPESIDLNDPKLQKELKQITGIHLMNEESLKAFVVSAGNSLIEPLNELGDNPFARPILTSKSNIEIQKLFMEAGEDLVILPNDKKRAIVGLNDTTSFQSSAEDYQKYCSPRFGTKNPEIMNNPFWRDMIRIGCDDVTAREHFNKNDLLDEPAMVWCFNRSNSSLIQLKDGRLVQIGGEHEYSESQDSFVYNDVVVHDGKGEFQIYGYPKDVFVPLDFRTAVLVDNCIYIIGGEKNQNEEKPTKFHVYRLNIKTWNIEAIQTMGELPFHPAEFTAIYKRPHNVLYVLVLKMRPWKFFEKRSGRILGMLPFHVDQEEFELDLSTFQWRKLDNVVPTKIKVKFDEIEEIRESLREE